MPIELKLQNSESGSTATLAIKGELDQVSLKNDYFQGLSTTNKQSMSNLAELTVDLSEVNRADTAGLAWLLNLKKDFQSGNTKVKFVEVPSKLLNLADLSNAKQFINS